jgi:2-C-methyl-D-erythritol 4-phosphate cytidylyltransferase/2-C-methyl-D-erythritol 2,4-cyclodiphosphate synthase
VDATAIIVAAGRGLRAGLAAPKQFHAVGGRALLAWSAAPFLADSRFHRVVVVVDPSVRGAAESAIGAQSSSILWADGGATRTQSVLSGLRALADAGPETVVFIHDAARPGLSQAVLDRLFAALAAGVEGTAPALALSDALKRVSVDGAVLGSAQREGLRRVQTPQAFRLGALRNAYAALSADAALDDDLAALEAAGGSIQLVDGDPRLMKATYPEDFAMLEALLGAGAPCTGHGVDAHRFGPGDHVTLCGVRIPAPFGLVGHSDADAPWHALTDAILGALGEGDIGDHFPPTDERWRGAPSRVFLEEAARLTTVAGARLVHVDVTVICEQPRVKPHRAAMRAATAEVLGLPLSRVSVKATTTEEMGFTGRREGLAAQATATVLRPW